jgi:hypothetical protein
MSGAWLREKCCAEKCVRARSASLNHLLGMESDRSPLWAARDRVTRPPKWVLDAHPDMMTSLGLQDWHTQRFRSRTSVAARILAAKR